MGKWDDLLIKGQDDTEFKLGYSYYNVRMGAGFIDAIEAGVQLKDTIENDSRKEHGVRALVSVKKAKRNVTLTFNIFGATKTDYMTNKKAFEDMLYKGLVSLKVNDADHTEYYHLIYTGKSVSYKHSYSGVFGTVAYQFIEPNPSERTITPSEKVRVFDAETNI